METRFYSERSNARRAARSAGIDPDAVFETPDGFTFSTNPALDEMTEASRFAMPSAAKDPLDIPPALKLSADERKAGWAANPPKATPMREDTMAKAKPKAAKAKPKGATGAVKTETLLKMLKGDGSTVEDICKATGWLPHTLRARLSSLAKPKKDGGMALKIERERVEGVTSYRAA